MGALLAPPEDPRLREIKSLEALAMEAVRQAEATVRSAQKARFQLGDVCLEIRAKRQELERQLGLAETHGLRSLGPDEEHG